MTTANSPLTDFESRCISLILKGRINKTYKAVADFRSKDKYGGGGMGVDWDEGKKKGLKSEGLEMYQSFFQNSSDQERIPRAAIIFYDMMGRNLWDAKRLIKRLGIDATSETLNLIIFDLNKYKGLRTIAEYRRNSIEEYEVLATLDLEACPQCGKMDKKVYKVSDAKIGVNCPPFHCGCRCCTAPFIRECDFSGETRAARDPITHKSVQVEDISYSEWYEKYVKSKLK